MDWFAACYRCATGPSRQRLGNKRGLGPNSGARLRRHGRFTEICARRAESGGSGTKPLDALSIGCAMDSPSRLSAPEPVHQQQREGHAGREGGEAWLWQIEDGGADHQGRGQQVGVPIASAISP